jgi:hypothetical protein
MSTIFAEANIAPGTRIKILKLDCEGCEYAVVPAFTDEEFALVDDMIGEIHWGYMPAAKQPPLYGSFFSTEIYTRGCHWFPHLLA